jgi:hypothetical protein
MPIIGTLTSVAPYPCQGFEPLLLFEKHNDPTKRISFMAVAKGFWRRSSVPEFPAIGGLLIRDLRFLYFLLVFGIGPAMSFLMRRPGSLLEAFARAGRLAPGHEPVNSASPTAGVVEPFSDYGRSGRF